MPVAKSDSSENTGMPFAFSSSTAPSPSDGRDRPAPPPAARRQACRSLSTISSGASVSANSIVRTPRKRGDADDRRRLNSLAKAL
jgi:hypothetical protein